MQVRQLDHVQLAMPAGREDDARAFYHVVLGIPEVANPSYSPNPPAAMSLRIHNLHVHTPPPAGLTEFQIVSARCWRLIRRGSTGALAPPLTLDAGSAHQPIHGTGRRRGSSRRTPV